MFAKSCSAWLLIGLWLTQAPLYAQSSRRIESDTVTRTPSDVSAPKGDPNLSDVVKQIVEATNQFRRQEGRREVAVHTDLARAAQYFANYMAQTDKYSHTADGSEPWDRAAK